MTDNENQTLSKITLYLPRHPVINPHKFKIRVVHVFDCAAKHHQVFLNEIFVSGQDLINNLIGVLMIIKKKKIVLVTDVEQTLHQVKVTPEHQGALRFLW